jgi:hypothetical protein
LRQKFPEPLYEWFRLLLFTNISNNCWWYQHHMPIKLLDKMVHRIYLRTSTLHSSMFG